MLVTVDTGGTKTLVASFLEDGIIHSSVKFPTPSDEATYLSELISTIQSVASDKPIDAIVVALPGIVKNDIGVWFPHLPWVNFDVKTPLAAVFKKIPILVENDANLGGLGEVRLLKTIPTSALYVTVSTGIGTGVIANGSIDPGLRLSEGGHIMVEYDGVVREWESFAAGSAIYKAYGKYARDIHSKRTWLQIADRISRGFLTIIPMVQPDIIIIGGSMGTFFDQYGLQLKDILRERLPNHIPCPQIVSASHPEQAVIYGAYFYAIDNLAPKKA